MRVLLLTGVPQDADVVREAFIRAVPDGTFDVCAPDEAAAWLAAHPDTHAVLIAADLTDQDAWAASLAAVRALSATVPVAALTPAGDERAQARALLAGADAVIPLDEATTPHIATHLGAIRSRSTLPDMREWRVLFAGRDTELRRALAQILGPSVVLMSLWVDGRLVPIIDRPGSATALVVDGRDDVDGMLLALRHTRRAYPSLPTLVVCDEPFHDVFLREGVDACVLSDVGMPRLLRAVADACDARRTSAELALPDRPAEIERAPVATVSQADLVETTRALDAALARVAQLEDQARARAEAVDAELQAASDRAQRLEAALDTRMDDETRWLLYEVAAIGHITTTAEARILGANDIAARLLGHFSGDALQASGRLPAPILRAAGAFDQRPTRFEVCLQHGDHGPLHWLVGLATPHAGVPATITWMLLDVTEQRLQARRARFLRRMDGLIHVLSAASAETTTLVGRAAPLLDAAVDTLGTREDLDVAGTRTSLTRTQAVLTQLSGYARRRARQETVHDLRDIIDAASAVLVHLAGEDILCTISHGDEPLHATLEPAEFQPLLTSLVMAGREALPLGGHLSLTTRAVESDAGNGGAFFVRPSIEMTLLAEGYGALRPEGLQPLEEAASRQGGTLLTTADDRNEVRWVLRLARVFVTP